MNGPYISALHIYPIKSMGPVDVRAALLGDRGFEHDRRWMLVDEQGRFVSQRQHHSMARIGVRMQSDHLEVSAPGNGVVQVPLAAPDETSSLTVRIWNDTCTAHAVSDECDRWFRKVLGAACRLVYMPEESQRTVRAPYATDAADRVGFADSFPYLVISEASLNALNERLPDDTSVSMRRFRPNIVVAGCLAHGEDTWKRIGIGDARLRAGKSCSRCVITTLEPDSGVRGSEPLVTLRTYRLHEGKVLFGQKFIQEWGDGSRPGVRIAVGDTVEVLESRPAPAL